MGVAAQLRQHALPPLGERGCEAADEGTAGAGGVRGEVGPMMAVDEHQPDAAVPGRTSGQTVELLQGWPLKPSLRRKLELHLSERSKAGVLPLFVLRGGKAQLGEAGEGRLATGADRPIVQPGEATAQAVSETHHRPASRRSSRTPSP